MKHWATTTQNNVTVVLELLTNLVFTWSHPDFWWHRFFHRGYKVVPQAQLGTHQHAHFTGSQPGLSVSSCKLSMSPALSISQVNLEPSHYRTNTGGSALFFSFPFNPPREAANPAGTHLLWVYSKAERAYYGLEISVVHKFCHLDSLYLIISWVIEVHWESLVRIRFLFLWSKCWR